MTPLTGKYRYIRERYNHRTDGSTVFPDRNSKRYSLHDMIDGRRIALSSVTIRTEWDEASAGKFLASRHGGNWPGDEPPPFHIKHTSVANSRRIMAHAEFLFNRVLTHRSATPPHCKHWAGCMGGSPTPCPMSAAAPPRQNSACARWRRRGGWTCRRSSKASCPAWRR